MLDVTDVSVIIDGQSVLDGTSISIATGDTVALVGPSGIGKSTLLRAICGLVRIDSGRVIIDNVDVTSMPTHRRGIGFVSQSGDLFPTMTVAENIEFGLRVNKMSPVARRERVLELLSLVRMDGFEERQVTTLSGGEQRRVALARALAPMPRVLLLDEPLTGLDDSTHDSLQRDLKDVLARAHTTTLLVTHDLAEARFLASRIVTMG